MAEEARLRKLGCNGDPVILLALRDVAGLRARLEGTDRDTWERGWGWVSFTPQDLAVLVELENRYAESPYRGADALRRLREALEWYDHNHFDFDDRVAAPEAP